MTKRSIKKGRPPGSTTFQRTTAIAFGDAVRSVRTQQGMAQETLANLAGIERSHMGKVERGEHLPTLALIFRIARALKCGAGDLVTAAERNLQGDDVDPIRGHRHED